MRLRTSLVVVAALVATGTACTAILGDFDEASAPAGDGGGPADGPALGDSSSGADAGCPTNQAACTGGCFDLTSSATNCGTCEKSCFGGTCASSKCTPYVVATQPKTGTVTKVATDGKRVVWADTGVVAIEQIPAGGGTPIVLASVSPVAGGVGGELSLSHGVVAYDYAGGANPPEVGIAAVDVADSGVPLIAGTVGISGISLGKAGTHVFYVDTHGTSADLIDCTVFPGDAGPCVGVSGGRFASETAADDTYMFFDLTGSSGPQPGLYLDRIDTAISVDNPNIFSTITTAQSLRVDGTWAYWTEAVDGGPGFTVHRTLESAPGTSLQTPVSPIAAKSFATDGTNVYYWTGTNIASRPVAGGSETTIAPASTFVDIAVGGGLLVWTDGTTINGLELP